jgi:hypothetical protein
VAAAAVKPEPLSVSPRPTSSGVIKQVLYYRRYQYQHRHRYTDIDTATGNTYVHFQKIPSCLLTSSHQHLRRNYYIFDTITITNTTTTTQAVARGGVGSCL